MHLFSHPLQLKNMCEFVFLFPVYLHGLLRLADVSILISFFYSAPPIKYRGSTLWNTYKFFSLLISISIAAKYWKEPGRNKCWFAFQNLRLLWWCSWFIRWCTMCQHLHWQLRPDRILQDLPIQICLDSYCARQEAWGTSETVRWVLGLRCILTNI